MNTKPRTAYHRGAQDGLIMGVWLTAVFLLQVLGMKSTMALYLSELFLLSVPVLAFLLLRRGYREEMCLSHFSAIWMHGITMFICGCLILGLVSYVYFRLVNPTFIADLVQSVADIYLGLGTEEGDQIGHTFERIIEKNLLPSPISMAFSIMWLGSFLGAILSMIIAGLLKAFCRYPAP